MKIFKHFSLFFVALITITSCTRNPVTGKREIVLMSKSQELAMGQQYDPEIIKQYGLYDNKILQNLLDTKGKEMGKISHRPEIDYKFRLLDSPVVNAFAVPGGYVYFTRGIMAHFNNEAEMAGVLGHEIGHITARHSAKQYSRQTMIQALYVGGLIFSPQFRNFADLANQGMGLLFLRFSRAHERQSDQLGVEYSTDIGYNSHKMAEFFGTLEKLSSQSGSLPQFLSTHPDPGDRYRVVNEYTDTMQQRKNVTDTNLKVNRDSYLSLIDGLLFGNDPKQGFVENDKFYHPELLFEFEIPKTWTTNNTPSQVQLIPEGGKSVILFELEAGSDLNTAANAVIERNKITVIEQNSTTVNGNQALAIIGEFKQAGQNGQEGADLRLLTYLIKYNNQIFKFIGLAAKADFNSYFGNFQNTMTSFKKLTDQSKINKLPERIKIVSVKKTGSLQSALADYSINANKYEELSILNGMELNETIQSGTKFKILELRQ